jgi:alpha-galactosidase
MPGGVSRAMRMIPPMIAIAKDVERLSPNARFINYSNPMTAIVRALRKHTNLPAVGLCMGTEDTVRDLAGVAGVPHDTVTARWAGVNHLTWILEMRSGGVDLWPKIREVVATRRRNGIDRTSWANAFGQAKVPNQLSMPFSWELFDEFGAFPAPMDRHVTEYFPERFPHGAYYGSTLGVDAYSFEGTIAAGDRIYENTLSLGKGEGALSIDRTGGEHEQMLEVLDSMRYDRRRWFAANIPNQGVVSNLPKDAVLEIPCVATQHGIVAPPLGEIPTPIAAVLLRRLGAVEAIVEAAVTGNRKLFAQALVLDGGVENYAQASKLADALIEAQKQHLPQFA